MPPLADFGPLLAAFALGYGGFLCLALAQGPCSRAGAADARPGGSLARRRTLVLGLLGALLLTGSFGAALWGAVGGPVPHLLSWAAALAGNLVALAAALAWQAHFLRFAAASFRHDDRRTPTINKPQRRTR